MGTESGVYVSAYRLNETKTNLYVLSESEQKLEIWETDDWGRRTQLSETLEGRYVLRQRPWYKRAVEAGEAAWSDVYFSFSIPIPLLSANQPMYDPEGQLIGVASTDLSLDHISQFLSDLKLGGSGRAFIIERNGLLVASSTEKNLFKQQGEKLERLSVEESIDDITRLSIEEAINQFSSLDNIRKPETFLFEFEGEREFVKVTPLFDPRGLDWLIVVVLHENDFIEKIERNNEINIILTLICLAIAVAIGICTSHWISQPIYRLCKATQSLAQGELNTRVDWEGIEEVEVLSSSFNQMADQLQSSFETLEEKVAERTAELEGEKEKSEELLLNILPKVIADRLKIDRRAIAEHYSEVTILFADIVGFTVLSSKLSPLELVNLLNHFFSAFDELALKYGLEKIKTIGDAYMVVGGLPIPRADHAETIADMALEMQAFIEEFQVTASESFQIRIGINTGEVVSGVIGLRKFVYDLWGDAVNVASRMESSGLPGHIQVTQETYEKLKDNYILEERGIISVKGKGEMMTYWLKGKKTINN